MIHLLIDGYNLLYSIHRGYVNHLEEKRAHLLRSLHRYQTEKQVHITVIFDSSTPEFLGNEADKLGQVQIVFARSVSADEHIKDLCQRNRGKYVVVSNDHEVIYAAEVNSCISLKCDDFIPKLKPFMEAREENPYFEDKEDSGPLYPKVSTKKKGRSRKLPKKERRKFSQLKNL